jgi:hypothetical protein
MQVFEFHFNPKAKEDVIFDSFVFEPESIWERKMGRLYMVGSLSHLLPQNLRFLEQLSSQIKKEYYRVSERTPELSLKESLRKANEFLAEEAKKGNVSWLGNLDFAVLSLKDAFLNFTSTGDISIFLLRRGRITDINQALRLQEIEPYPLKIFGNVVSGRVAPTDRIVIMTREIADFFATENLLPDIAKVEKIEENILKKILQGKETLYSNLSGICFLVDLTEEAAKEKITFEKRILPFSIWRAISSFSIIKFRELFPKVLGLPKIRIKTPQKPQISLPILNLSALPIFKFINSLRKIDIFQLLKRNLYLVLALTIILLLGSFSAGLEKRREIQKAQLILIEIEEKIQLAKEALILENEKEANFLYQEAWDKILPLAKIDSPVEAEALKLKSFIDSQLIPLNKLRKIDNPEMIFDFKDYDFIPQKMVGLEDGLYFFDPYTADVYRLSPKEKEVNVIKIEEKFNLGAVLKERGIILFFSRPNKLFSFRGNQFSQAFFLKDPYPDYQFNDFTVFKSNLYFLDSKKGEILKYAFSENQIVFEGNLWITPEIKKPQDSRSLAVDGSIWILRKEGEIEKYTLGSLKEKLELSFFPDLERPTKIFTKDNLPYLYILEPAKKRIIIITKTGEIWQQFQSDQFNNLKDFSVSEDGKTVYLLSGVKVYQISI